MARVRLCVCGSWFVGREGQLLTHVVHRASACHFECRGAPARVRVWRCEGRPPLPHHFVCVERFTLPYLTEDRRRQTTGRADATEGAGLCGDQQEALRMYEEIKGQQGQGIRDPRDHVRCGKDG